MHHLYHPGLYRVGRAYYGYIIAVSGSSQCEGINMAAQTLRSQEWEEFIWPHSPDLLDGGGGGGIEMAT